MVRYLGVSPAKIFAHNFDRQFGCEDSLRSQNPYRYFWGKICATGVKVPMQICEPLETNKIELAAEAIYTEISLIVFLEFFIGTMILWSRPVKVQLYVQDASHSSKAETQPVHDHV
jgi:hypothetical protein